MGRSAAAVAATAAALLLGPGAATAVDASGPVATVAPSVIGSATAGKILTGLSGTWGGFGAITYRFQWYRCNAAGANCSAITGATSPTLSLENRDVGKTLGLTVSASDSTGTTAGFASLVGPIAPRRPLLESTAQPVVTGPPVEGKVVQVTTGTWSPVPAALAYRWERCNDNGRVCAAIPNATQSSYTVTSADLGHSLLAIVRADNGGTIQDAFSTATPGVVEGSVRGPAMTFGPTVGGLAIEGQALAAQTGIWRGIGSVLFTYRWYRCDADGGNCRVIANASQAIYTTRPRDVGATIGLGLVAADSTGHAVAYASLVGPVAAATAALTATTPPTISGTARVGGALTVDYGLWSARPSGYQVSWLRCNGNGRLCAPIAGATGPSYQPTVADRGHTLVVAVAASAGDASQAALSAATAAIVG